MSRFLSTGKEMDRELALMALAASQTPEEACEYLKREYKLIAKPSHLAAARKMCPEQYEDLRTRIKPLKEKTLSHNLLDNALYASEVTNQAIEQLGQRISEGRVNGDALSKIARDLADVQAKSIDKKLSIEGRPTQITEVRDVADIVRALEAKNIVRQIEVGQDD